MKGNKILWRFVVILTVSTFPFNGFGQESLTETPTHIFWQPDLKLTPQDFQGKGDYSSSLQSYCKEYGLCTSASVGVFAILDIPRKKKLRGELVEKAYFAPAFEKGSSFILEHDSMGILKQKIVFDIYEISARFARKELQKLRDTIPGYGITSIMFKSVQDRAEVMRNDLSLKFTIEMYVEPVEGAYEKWRKEVDDLLEKTKEFATRPEDCYRFVKNEPIEKGYIKAKKVTGSFFNE